MATTALNRDLVQMIAEEIALGRLDAIREIVENYRHLTGQSHLDSLTLPVFGAS